MLTYVWKYSFSICCLIFNLLTFIGDLFFVFVLPEFCDEVNANPSLEFGPFWRVWYRVSYLTGRGMHLSCQERACFLSVGSMRTELPWRPAFPSPGPTHWSGTGIHFAIQYPGPLSLQFPCFSVSL